MSICWSRRRRAGRHGTSSHWWSITPGLAEIVRATVGAGHVKLVETLAERIAAASFFDPRIRRSIVRVEKLEALDDVRGAGVEIVREAGDLSTRPD